MKKNSTFLVIILLVLSINTINAQIPNNGFEDWATDDDGQYNPVGWTTLNDDPYICATPYTPAYAEIYSMKVTTVDYGFAVVPGAAQAEFPYAQRPATIEFCLKATVMPGDRVYVVVSLYDGDSIIAAPGNCTFSIDTTIENYTCLSYPITYLSNKYPTSGNIMILAGTNTPQVGTFIVVDEIQFSGTTGINNSFNASEKIVRNFPNPAQNYTYLHVKLSKESDVEVVIMDMNGKLVQSIPYQSLQSGKNDLLVNTSQFANGIYTYSVKSKDFNYFGKMVVCN